MIASSSSFENVVNLKFDSSSSVISDGMILGELNSIESIWVNASDKSILNLSVTKDIILKIFIRSAIDINKQGVHILGIVRGIAINLYKTSNYHAMF